MNLFSQINNNTLKRGFSTIIVVSIISIIIYILILTQFILNLKIYNLRNNILNSEDKMELYYLDSIVKMELKNLENFIKKDVYKINQFFDSDMDNNKIFLLSSFDERISIGGYKLINDGKNIIYKNILKKKIDSYFKKIIDISYQKEIIINNDKFYIKVTIGYLIDNSKKPENLSFDSIKRIWVKKYD